MKKDIPYDDPIWESEKNKLPAELRRKEHSLCKQALSLLSDSERETAAAFRTAFFTHLTHISAMCERASTYFSDDALEALAKKVDVKGVSADKTLEVCRKFIRKAFGPVKGSLMLRGRDQVEWVYVGLLDDELCGTVFARVWSPETGSPLQRLIAIAYFDDEVMVPAHGSQWFWESDITIGYRFPSVWPFERATVDPVNDPRLTESLARTAVEKAITEITDAREAVEKAKNDKAAEEATDKLRAQLSLSAIQCAEINRLAQLDSDSFNRSATELPLRFSEDLLNWLHRWLEEDDIAVTYRRGIVPFGDKKVSIPATIPGSVQQALAGAYTRKEIYSHLSAYAKQAASRAVNEPGLLEQVFDDVSVLVPEVHKQRDAFGVDTPGATLEKLAKWLKDTAAEVADDQEEDTEVGSA